MCAQVIIYSSEALGQRYTCIAHLSDQSFDVDAKPGFRSPVLTVKLNTTSVLVFLHTRFFFTMYDSLELFIN